MTHELKMKSQEELGNGLKGRITARGHVHVRGLWAQPCLERPWGPSVLPPGAQGPSPLRSPRGRLGDPDVQQPPEEKGGERSPEGIGPHSGTHKGERQPMPRAGSWGRARRWITPHPTRLRGAGTQEGERQLLPPEFEG